MGFFSGRASFGRFRVAGKAPGMFEVEHLQKLAANAIGKSRKATADGVDVGWIAGDHILDVRFDLAKNVVNDTLHCAIRVDQMKIPGDLLRAYTQVELEGLAAANPSGIASRKQRQQAKETARERLEQEAQDGRFLKRKFYPVLWDALSNELLVGTTSASVLDRLHPLFEQTFGQPFELLGAGRRAFFLAEPSGQTRAIDDAKPSVFVPGTTPPIYDWAPDDNARDFLGNEFLMWLWFQLDCDSDTLKLSDGSEVALMLARTLVLQCPRGQTGRETISSDGPTRLPEAKRAVQAGKLPRKVGVTMVRHDNTYEITLDAETLAVSGARLPAPEELEERARLEERVNQIRHLLETLDLLYEAFVRVRASDDWPRELARIQKWLAREERSRVSAAG